MVETRFYRDLSPSVGIRTPRAYYAGLDDATGRSLIIMDDVIANGGAFLNAFTPYSLETATSTLAQLALLHAKTWDTQERPDFQWLRPKASMTDVMPTETLQGLLDDGRGPDLPAYLRDAELVKEAMRRVEARPAVCVIHGDTHSGNVYVDRDGRPCWLDWQITKIGHWATDVGYHIATVLDIESRRQHEAALLRGYLEELSRLGQEPPSWEDAWDQYSLHIAYGYFLWSITRISSRLVVLEHIPRLGAALVDHDTFHRLGL
jgi:aminoglycoside phosphotransferase (APT) family kinase protein